MFKTLIYWELTLAPMDKRRESFSQLLSQSNTHYRFIMQLALRCHVFSVEIGIDLYNNQIQYMNCMLESVVMRIFDTTSSINMT